MTTGLYNFTGATNPDQTLQPGMAQYIAQGQAGLQPGPQQIAASNPISAVGQMGLGKALAQAIPQQPLPAQQLPPAVAQSALQQGAAQQPNVNGQNMGGVGPTPQNLALANMLQNPNQNQGISY